jgi:hypothetical protein
MKYRKRPVEVEAIKFTGEWQPIMEWLDSLIKSGRFPVPLAWQPPVRAQVFISQDGGRRSRLEINTLDSVAYAEPGDWVIQGVQGEFYPCKPDIFAQTYEEV